ncbi:hypothetical protein [Mycolicibacterium litorale]|uniref:hypothetical protein n=1 Tax=Mycolicibacterium litorale TaxID=758802 RepID=UPI001066C45E|nr:hypothetical protein [Mycolicibacterium litorale]MCV7416877.1 hypothetical protein [Mycolicibacterium litorale]TDY04662.1 hypothetical protein BCL50_3437 [Mycolicibacterium litorale]
MTGPRDDDEAHSGREADAPAPWHHSTAKVLGASVAAIAALALIVTGVMFVSRKAGETPEAPLNFVDPTFSSMTSEATTEPTTATTTTRISPPLTTDLDLPPEMATSTPPSETTSSGERPSTRKSEESEESDEREDESAAPTTTRNRPRLNETRTLYPRP